MEAAGEGADVQVRAHAWSHFPRPPTLTTIINFASRRYGQIDPLEFAEAKEKVTTLEKEMGLREAKAEKREELIKKMRADYSKAKGIVEALKKERETLREEKSKVDGEKVSVN